MALDQSQGVPTAPDYDEIVQFIQTGYIDACNETNFSKMRRLFYEDAWYFFIHDDGTLYKGPLNDEKVRDWTSEGDWEWRVLSVTQAGDVASVMLEMHSQSEPDNRWVDIHALLRIDGQWHDMNKTAVHASRAGWAGR
jgi:hypothetical protein